MQKLVRAILPTRRSEGSDRLSLPIAIASSFLVVALTAACAPAAASRDEGRTLTVAAASDLQFAFAEIGRLFEEETGARVTFTFGSSGNLARQIENGAPIDLFASADEAYVQGLTSRGAVLPDSVRLYAIGRIVLASNRASGAGIQRLEELLRPEVARVALANPDHAPYGRAGRQALESAGLWDALQPKLVYGENVRQALQFVQTGNAEAGIVALSIAEVPEIDYVLIDDALHAPLRQALGAVRGGREDLARQFAGFVTGPRGRPVMERYGFLPPGEG